jgi:hypothetical protein
MNELTNDRLDASAIASALYKGGWGCQLWVGGVGLGSEEVAPLE